MQQANDLLETSTVAWMCGVAAQTVRMWEKTGKLKAIKTASGQRLFKRRDVEEFKKQRKGK